MKNKERCCQGVKKKSKKEVGKEKTKHTGGPPKGWDPKSRACGREEKKPALGRGNRLPTDRGWDRKRCGGGEGYLLGKVV